MGLLIGQQSYTLEDLAQEFGLTPRTARHYIENLLPDHHKQGRGKLATYGPDTRNCFAFIAKAKGEHAMTAQQIKDVLSRLDQKQIDRVALGEEELRIVPISPFPLVEDNPTLRASRSLRHNLPSIDESAVFERSMSLGKRYYQRMAEPQAPGPAWQTLYDEGGLKILFRGEVSPEQREEVELAARMIRRILE